MATLSPAKRNRSGSEGCGFTDGSDEAALRAKIAALESERDMWRSQVEGAGPRFPATHWPDSKPSLKPVHSYPVYDVSRPKVAFLAVNDMLIEEVCGELVPGYEMPSREVQRVREMLDYNICGGKMNRGLMVVESGLLILESMGRPVSNATTVRLAILGWCIEWMQAWLLIADDFMDDSKTRRGRACWYRRDDVQKIALNDALMIEMLVFKILKRHFVAEPYYIQLVDLFLETTFQTECGQMLDTLCMNLDIKDFTIDRWTLIVKYKTAFYSFYASVAIGMIIAGITDVAEFNACRQILITMGIYFQAQDDYLDCYGTEEQIGKIGTDIQDKKCGWLFVHVYQRLSSPEQKALLERVYGKYNVQSPEEQQVKDLYTTLGMKELYQQYEKDSYAEILAAKHTVKQVPWSVFEAFLNKIYKRDT